MNIRNRILSGLLALALLLPMGLPALAADAGAPEEGFGAPQAVGQLQATLRLDLAQSQAALESRNVQATLLQGEETLGQAGLWDSSTQSLGAYPASVQLKNADGGDDTIGWPKFVTLTVGDLPQGDYTLRFTGLGYKAFSYDVPLQTHSQHLILGNGGAAFTLGDLNGDGQVDTADRDVLAGKLGGADPLCDLDGDGEVGLADLVSLMKNLDVQGEAELMSTTLLAPPVELEGLTEGGAQVAEGDLRDLFADNGQGVTLRAEGSVLDLPIGFTEPVEMAQIQIAAPENGGMDTGAVLVEYEDGHTESLPFDAVLPEGVYAIGKTEGVRTITLDLGRRVPVKKITVSVEKTEDGYVSVDTIQFLKDIVPENPVAPNRMVNGLHATAGSESATLKWKELPNVTGYRVDYWPDGEESNKRSLPVNVPYAQVTGLENLQKYWFQVTPTAEGWEGDACQPVDATPQPSKSPNAPDMVSITELDGALGVSWKASEGATYYEVYYKEQSSSGAYQRIGGSLAATSTTITNLRNGVVYQIYIVAGNDVGKSGPSRIAEGTPKAVDYDRPEGLPTSSLLSPSKIKSIRLGAPNNYKQDDYTEEAPFKPENMIDGDYRTHWTASNWYGNEHVITTFTEPVDLQSVIWSPRLDGNYPQWLRAYSIQVWYEGEDLSQAGHLLMPVPERGGFDSNGGSGGGDVHTWPNIPNRGSIPTTKFGILPFPPAQNVVQISVAVEQADYNLVSCSELMFMEYDPAHCLPDEIAALFTDGLCTQLKLGVTQERIDALRERLNSDEKYYYVDLNTLADELKLAEELLSGATPYVREEVQSRSGAADGAKYSQGGSDLQPLGAAAKAGQEVTIYASGIPEGETVTVYASQFNAEASAWRAEVGTLQNGRNTLLVPKIGSQNTPRGGSLYFTYSGTKPQDIRMHVRRATAIPTLELSGWYGMTEAARRNAIEAYLTELEAYVAQAGLTEANKATDCLNVTEISTPTVLLSLPALAVWNNGPAGVSAKAEVLFQSILAWEDTMHICKYTQGIDNTYGDNDMQTRQNVRCMQMFAGAFMYAAGNHIGIGYGSCAGMVSGKPISALSTGFSANSLFGWGIAHEIGHNMDKLGRAEITNNIYSLMVQTYDGKENTLASRLEKSGKYASIFNKTAQGYPGASNDVFTQLGLYWQLHLAYDGGDDPMGFYNRFFKAWKAGTYTQGFAELSYDDKMALTAAGTAQRDLTEFFTRWGMVLSEEVKAKLATYPAEPRAVWYLSDQSRRDRLAGKAAGSVNHLPTAGMKPGSDTEVEIRTAIRDSQGIQGYEILRDNKPIAFVQSAAVQDGLLYTDVIGSGNHLAFTYSVKAYDSLGNLVDTAEAGQVRIAYDKTVPATAYTLSRTGDTATFTLKEETAVSGLKISGGTRPASGVYTVAVTQEDGSTVTARKGSFDTGNQAVDDQDSYLTYFNKPGTASTDTRIWTYDAKTVTVTGIPASVPDSAIQLVSYAGDDVAFLTGEDGFMGRLQEDYRYGDGQDDVIPAGTLVIVGTYRGDPVYNTLHIKGKFSKTVAAVDEDGNETVQVTEEIRDIDGYALMFAEIPEDQQVSDISDGLFLFVPNVQKEAELQDATHCDGENLLPSQVMAELYRQDDPNGGGGQRTTAQTLWTNSPGGVDLPIILLESEK